MSVKKKNNSDEKRAKALRPSFAFTTPAIVIYTIAFVLPVIMAFGLSLTNWNGLEFSPSKFHFTGFENYIRMFHDNDLWNSIKVTLKITVIVATIANIGGLCIALLLSSGGKLTNFVRSVFFIPYVMSSVAVSFIWMAIMAYNGLLNSMLELFSFDKLSLFGNPQSALACICFVEIWRTMGFYMVLYIAALQGIPAELTEAGIIDGASKWDLFWNVKLPMIAPQVVTGFMMAITMEMRIYDIIFIMTDGGPGTATRSISYEIVTEGFKSWRMGYAGSIAVLLSAMVIIIAVSMRKLQKHVEVDI